MNQATSALPKAVAAEETNVEEVALFPIPDLVAFPGTVDSIACVRAQIPKDGPRLC